MKTTNTGFTLAETAIVLVTVGLVLGGVLKAQELVVQSKIKRVIADITGVSAAMYAYHDRYRALPGDDKGSGRWGLTPPSSAGNGIIEGTYASTAPYTPSSQTDVRKTFARVRLEQQAQIGQEEEHAQIRRAVPVTKLIVVRRAAELRAERFSRLDGQRRPGQIVLNPATPGLKYHASRRRLYGRTYSSASAGIHYASTWRASSLLAPVSRAKPRTQPSCRVSERRRST